MGRSRSLREMVATLATPPYYLQQNVLTLRRPSRKLDLHMCTVREWTGTDELASFIDLGQGSEVFHILGWKEARR